MATGSGRAERYGGEFLNIPIGARALAMGGAYGPVSGDASAQYWNPAGLAGLSSAELLVSHTALFGNLAYHDYLGLAGQISRKLWLGLGWIRLGVDDIPRFSHTIGTPPEGIFSDNENALLFSGAGRRHISVLGTKLQLAGGASLKLIYSRLNDRQATGLGLDLGLLLKANLADMAAGPNQGPALASSLISQARYPYLGTLALSLCYDDIGGTNISWDTPRRHQDVRISSLKAGAAYRQPIVFMRSALLVSWETSTEALQKTRLGGELDLHQHLFLRAGLDQRKLVWGGGLAFWRIKLDYALSKHDLGNTHRVSGSFQI